MPTRSAIACRGNTPWEPQELSARGCAQLTVRVHHPRFSSSPAVRKPPHGWEGFRSARLRIRRAWVALRGFRRRKAPFARAQPVQRRFATKLPGHAPCGGETWGPKDLRPTGLEASGQGVVGDGSRTERKGGPMKTKRVTLAKLSAALLAAAELERMPCQPLGGRPQCDRDREHRDDERAAHVQAGDDASRRQPERAYCVDVDQRLTRRFDPSRRVDGARPTRRRSRAPAGVTVTVDAVDPTVVSLEVQPASLSSFRVPVQLRYRAKNAGQARGLTIQWWNASRRS